MQQIEKEDSGWDGNWCLGQKTQKDPDVLYEVPWSLVQTEKNSLDTKQGMEKFVFQQTLENKCSENWQNFAKMIAGGDGCRLWMAGTYDCGVRSRVGTRLARPVHPGYPTPAAKEGKGGDTPRPPGSPGL